ncbi:MAG: hypothetical protein IPP77_02045 [Bacteroidetes bacterium]|nr:hypothetical protein [Bacteroidota bacterium]
MLQIIISSLVLSVIHATIPSHWLPLVAIGKAERWTKKRTLFATAVSGGSHIASTILIGILIGWAGYKLSESFQWMTEVLAPFILILLGIFYVVRNFHAHGHRHHFPEKPLHNKSFKAILISVSIGMFFSPCLELETYYFTAGKYGWAGIAGVSLVYLLVTVGFMMLFVALALEGISRYNFRFLDSNEKAVTGIVLILVGALTYFFNLT